jgi:hypothetical protein
MFASLTAVRASSRTYLSLWCLCACAKLQTPPPTPGVVNIMPYVQQQLSMEIKSGSGLRSSGPGSSVGIQTGYGLDGPGIESRWGARLSATVQTGHGAQSTSCTMCTGSFPGGIGRPGRDADPSPPSSAVVKKVQSYTTTPPMGCMAWTEPQSLYKGAL